MENSKLQEYAKIKAQIKVFEAQARLLELDVIKEVEAQLEGSRDKSFETGFAKFSLVGNRKYEYSPELVEKESLVKQQIKLMKRKEEVDGKATLLQDGYSLRVELKKGVSL